MEKWLLFFIKIFSLQKYKNIIKCEGLKTVLRNRKALKINNILLDYFIRNGLYTKLLSAHNRLLYLKIYYHLSKNKFRGAQTSAKTKIYNSLKKSNQIRYNKKYIFSIGINDYISFPKLSCAVNDANSISTFFSDNFNFYGESITNEYANKFNIEKLFKTRLYNILSKNDLLVISFHGHGITLNISEVDYGFIVPIDSPKEPTPGDLISMNDISNWIKYLNCNHVLILLDCCFSGMSLNTRASHCSDSLTKISKILKKKNRIIVNAGMDDEQVCDSGWNNNSPFVGAIISYPDYKITHGSVIRLYYYLMNTIPQNFSQIPTLGKLPGDQGGDIFLSL